MKTAPLEIEVRLAASPAAMARVANAPALRAVRVSAARTAQLLSVYWDTPAFTMRDSGFGLRMRRTGDRWVQTIKAELPQTATREEFETPATGERPQLALAVDAGWKASRSLLAVEPDLQPIFITRITRVSQTLTFVDKTVIELVRDRGELCVEGVSPRAEPVSEIELELKAGDVRQLYELAWKLVNEVPGLRLLYASKAERGYALLTGAPAPARHAQRLRRARTSGAKMLVVHAASEALVHVERNVEGARTEAAPDFVHQMRIGVRRLRVTTGVARLAGLPVFSDKLQAEVKWLWHLLGETRDWDVFESQTWPAVKRNAQDARSTSDFDARVLAHRANSHRKLRRALDGRRFQRTMLALAWVIANQRQDALATRGKNGERSLARKALRNSLERALRRGRAIDELAAGQRHQLRIAAKKLRYLAEFFRDLYPPGHVKRFLDRLTKVQAILGDLNDLDVTRELIDTAMGSDATEARTFLTELWERHAAASEASLERTFAQAWKRLADSPPFWETS